ncbi:CADD family putative folate metabolism protein [Wolbachia endosymbiont of Listronotus oregonensis]|uniref:CADD family putative folate metabolism protein n=1 Tax=unclassified Wolbachia TaxID=2640676 RepID=UPI0020A11AC4|nr:MULTISPECIES: CADD family putative folate metabolism protein [Rickettsiales]MBV2145591.1 CADD family putative folate metabolism protein [Wolbachia endosymbiont of Pissodes strobi]MDX5495749.1 CADD family putative folate metabolism protein [Wolbachia endosymbiont of Nomada marshamella]WMT84408.1 CADD family putative folate metabolism protein [Wolbachia endosymbiont of Listronotus oregonensis]
MEFTKSLNNKLDELHLLNHPFYQSWNTGSLSLQALQTYAKEYYHHVAAFPRYISGIHFLCPDLKMRQVLLGNLIEEEQGDENHPELWKRFAEGLGVTRSDLHKDAQIKETQELVDGYFDIVRSDFASGLGALYAYERQTPEVSKSKIEGLKKHYSISDERSLQFFTVHMHADEWHSEECANLIADLSEEEQEKAMQGAKKGAKLLWGFLDGMMNASVCH